MDSLEIYQKRLESILVYNGFSDAANNVYKFIRGKSVRQLQDVVELWRAWDNQDQWFNYADKVSVRDWYKRSQSNEAKEWYYR